MRDPYEVLEVEPGAPSPEIKRAYRRLARMWHPDRNSAPEAEARFKEVASAWEVLGDPEKRRRHDMRHGRAARGELPEDFLADVADAIDRAEHWIRAVVLPHYAQHWRGVGAEMAARLIADLDILVTPADLEPAGWWRRRRVARISDSIVVTVLMYPASEASVLIRGVGFCEVAILPNTLWRMGFREPSELDDAVMRLLLARYAQIFSGRGVRGHGLDPESMVAQSRAVDTAMIARRTSRIAGWSLLALVFGFLLLAGYNGW